MKPIDPNKIPLLDNATVEKYRKMTPAERLAIGFEMNKRHRRMLAENFKEKQPDWTDAALKWKSPALASHNLLPKKFLTLLITI